MDRRFKNTLIFFAPIIVIVLCIFFMFFHLKPLITYEPLKTYQYYDLVIKVIAAILTLSAVIVALFKDFFVSLFNYVDFKIENRDTGFVFEVYENNDPSLQPKTASSYETVLKVSNNGNLLAERCSIQVIEIVFKNDSTGIEKTLPEALNSSYLLWGNGKQEIDIHPENNVTVSSITLAKDSSPTVPGKNQGQNVILTIGGVTVPKDYINGKYEVVFRLLCKNHKAVEYRLAIAWDGTWKSRFSDMSGSYAITKMIKGNKKKQKNVKTGR